MGITGLVTYHVSVVLDFLGHLGDLPRVALQHVRDLLPALVAAAGIAFHQLRQLGQVVVGPDLEEDRENITHYSSYTSLFTPGS